MGKKTEFARSAASCWRMAGAALNDHDAAEWRQLSHYWMIMSRLIEPQDLEDRFAAQLYSQGTGQPQSEASH
jgi:hypothetical protein